MFATCGPNFGEVINIQAISCEKSSSVFCVGFLFFMIIIIRKFK